MSVALPIVRRMKVTFRTEAEDATEWNDPEFTDAYWGAVAEEHLAGERSIAAADMHPSLVPDEAHVPDRLGEEPAPPNPFALVERAGAAARAARAAAAEQDRLFAAILSAAAEDPDPWVGPDPTADPLWRDPRGWTVVAVREHRRSLAVRSAAADVGARVQLTDNQVRNRAHTATVLAQRCPQVRAGFLAGEISEQNAAITAELAASLPGDDPEVWTRFDDAVAESAATSVPGKFRLRARAARERAHRESLTARHARAAADRRVDVRPELDGMAFIGALVPAERARSIDSDLDQRARHLGSLEGETRTVAQIRADVFTDLLLGADSGGGTSVRGHSTTGSSSNDGGRKPLITATVRITIPALTVLGHGDEPATLDGYGPIPLDVAKELAAGAPSWIRVLTHPVTSTIVDVDRRAYKVPADIRRMLHTLHPTCVFPGCSRPADDCDYDHRRRWKDGGGTSVVNGQPLDGRHHPIKDETLWRSERDPVSGRIAWTSPSGYRVDEDPPPF